MALRPLNPCQSLKRALDFLNRLLHSQPLVDKAEYRYDLQAVERFSNIVFNAKRVSFPDHAFGFDLRNHDDFPAETVSKRADRLNTITLRHKQIDQQDVHFVQLKQLRVYVHPVFGFAGNFTQSFILYNITEHGTDSLIVIHDKIPQPSSSFLDHKRPICERLAQNPMSPHPIFAHSMPCFGGVSQKHAYISDEWRSLRLSSSSCQVKSQHMAEYHFITKILPITRR